MNFEQFLNLQVNDYVVFCDDRVIDGNASYMCSDNDLALSIRRGTIGTVERIFGDAQKDPPDYKEIAAYDWTKDEDYEDTEDDLYSKTFDLRIRWDVFENEDNQYDSDLLVADDEVDWCINSHQCISVKELSKYELINLFGHATLERLKHEKALKDHFANDKEEDINYG